MVICALQTVARDGDGRALCLLMCKMKKVFSEERRFELCFSCCISDSVLSSDAALTPLMCVLPLFNINRAIS